MEFAIFGSAMYQDICNPSSVSLMLSLTQFPDMSVDEGEVPHRGCEATWAVFFLNFPSKWHFFYIEQALGPILSLRSPFSSKPSFTFLFLLKSVFYHKIGGENDTKTSWLYFMVFTVPENKLKLLLNFPLMGCKNHIRSFLIWQTWIIKCQWEAMCDENPLFYNT